VFRQCVEPLCELPTISSWRHNRRKKRKINAFMWSRMSNYVKREIKSLRMSLTFGTGFINMCAWELVASSFQHCCYG
jgi:hypothetical protein